MDFVKEFGAVAAGCMIGVIATRAYFKKKYEKVANDEIEEMKKHYEKKVEEAKKNAPKSYATLNADAEAKSAYSGYATNEDEVVDYVTYRSEKMSDLVKTEHPEDDIPEEPYRISADEFINDGMYDKVTLTFYDEDAALAGEDDQIVEVSNTIGQDAYSYFVEADIDEMFVRNPHLSLDFEVVRVLGSYMETVVGETNS